MNKTIKTLTALLTLAVMLSSCAKTATEGLNVAAKRAFEAWLATHDKGQTIKTGHGVYITNDIPGDGQKAAYGQYIFMDYMYSTLEDSTLIDYSPEYISRQLGTYKQSTFYGPEIFHFVNGVVPIGLQDMIAGGGNWSMMKVGGYRECIIPGWLTSSDKYYDTEEEYLRNVSGSNFYYQLKLTYLTDDIEAWQQDTIQKFMLKTGKLVSDSTSCGVWYYRDKAREKARGVTVLDTVKFPSDTTIYINYIGRLLNGNVFDTNMEDSAKLYGLYNASSTYEPLPIEWSSDSTALTMDESSLIKGFCFTLWQMHPYESGRGIFPARLGYGADGNRPSIPGYMPLIFDIDIVAEPE